MSAAIIDDLTAITPEWLTTVLHGAGVDGDVRSVGAEPVGTGQMGSCYRLFVEYERGDGPTRLVVKLPAENPKNRSLAAVPYRCETGFYRQLADTVRVRVPRCYFSELSDDAGTFTLVLEDLAPAEQGDQIAGCTPTQARDAAVNVAGLHAATWCDESLPELDWIVPAGPESAEFVAAFLADSTTTFLERYAVDDATAEVLRGFSQRSKDWLTRRSEPFSLIHFDYRLDNLLFAPPGAPDPVVAVDWQNVTVGLPSRDVAFLVATGLHTDDRRAAERDIVAAYHEALLGHGVADYGADRCWDDYKYGLFQGPLVALLGAWAARRSDRGDRMFTVMAERSATAIVDHDAFSLI